MEIVNGRFISQLLTFLEPNLNLYNLVQQKKEEIEQMIGDRNLEVGHRE